MKTIGMVFLVVVVTLMLVSLSLGWPMDWDNWMDRAGVDKVSVADLSSVDGGEVTIDEIMVDDDNVVTVTCEGQIVAEVKFLTTVDNMPTEWLRDREGVCYLYQSGIGNEVTLEVTLMDNATFAMDGDWAMVNGQNLGVVDDAADFLAFADDPGTYRFIASSFGLAVGVQNGPDNKAGFVIQDRRDATAWDGRPVFWLSSEEEVVQLDPTP